MNEIVQYKWQIKSRYLLLFLFVSILGSIIITGIIVPDFFEEESSPLSEIIFGYLVYIILGYFLFTLGRKSELNWSNLFGNFGTIHISWKNIITAIPLIAIAFASVYLIFYPLSFYYPDFVYSMIVDSDVNFFWFSGTNYKLANFLSFLEIVLLAPIIEELFFRGFLFTSLALKYTPLKAIFLSSLLFGIFHIDILGGFIFGSVLCIIYINTKSLAPIMLIHILNNFIAFTWSYFYNISSKGEEYNLSTFQSELWMGVLGFIIGGIWLVHFYIKECKGNKLCIPYIANKGI